MCLKLVYKMFLWHQSSWQFTSSGMWHCVAGLVICDFSQECRTFIFKGQAVQEEFFLFRLLDLWRWRQHSPSKCWKSLNQQHCVTSQMIRILNYTSLKTSRYINHLLYWQGLTHVQFTAFLSVLALLWCGTCVWLQYAFSWHINSGTQQWITEASCFQGCDAIWYGRNFLTLLRTRFPLSQMYHVLK